MSPRTGPSSTMPPDAPAIAPTRRVNNANNASEFVKNHTHVGWALLPVKAVDVGQEWPTYYRKPQAGE
ncbi:hypothetical protein LOC70_09715 [Rhodopirellula sp. JC737]|nr:hypothetical protein [Rhodopirellula sp. JC737]